MGVFEMARNLLSAEKGKRQRANSLTLKNQLPNQLQCGSGFLGTPISPIQNFGPRMLSATQVLKLEPKFWWMMLSQPPSAVCAPDLCLVLPTFKFNSRSFSRPFLIRQAFTQSWLRELAMRAGTTSIIGGGDTATCCKKYETEAKVWRSVELMIL